MRSLTTFLTPLAVMLLSMGVFSGKVYALDRCEIPHGETYNIDEHSTCRAVTNNHASGQTIMVPTKSAAEWNTGANAFLNALPAGVTAAACSSCGTITNCAASGGGGGGVVAGAQTFSTAGSFNFTIPCFNTLTVQVWGAGGAGAHNGGNGGTGGASRWDGTVIANGGTGNRTGGTASGGTTNTTGGTGNAGGSCTGTNGKGGAGANGGAGGAARANGSAPGGAGGGGGWSPSMGCIQEEGGGGGGYSTRSYAAGAYTPGEIVQIIVGARGVASNSGNAGDGAVGRVTVTWN